MTRDEAIEALRKLRRSEDLPFRHTLVLADVIDYLLFKTQEVRCGYWDKKNFNFHYKCSECGTFIRNDIFDYEFDLMRSKLNYCPNCGARMGRE